jgi:hypothetical protein
MNLSLNSSGDNCGSCSTNNVNSATGNANKLGLAEKV